VTKILSGARVSGVSGERTGRAKSDRKMRERAV